MSPDARLIAPQTVPVKWVRETLGRLERWTEADHLSYEDRVSTIAAVLVNLRAELRQFEEG